MQPFGSNVSAKIEKDGFEKNALKVSQTFNP